METQLKLTFRDMPHSDAVEAHVRQRAAKLEHFARGITSCHVTIELPHRRHHTGRSFKVSIDLSLPGGQIGVSHGHEDDPAQQDAHAAIDHAFERAERRLRDFVQRRRGAVKSHEA